MRRSSFETDQLPFLYGIGASFVIHVVLVAIAIFVLQSAVLPPEKAVIFSVTLEGGEKLGGITQVPKEGAKKVITPDSGSPDAVKEPVKEETKEVEKTPEPPPEKEITQPTVVEDQTKKIEEQKKLEEAKKLEEKKKEEQKKKAEEKKAEDKKKAEEEKKKAAEDEKKKQAEEEKKKLEDDKKKAANEKKAREKQLSDALNKVKIRTKYEGESADAGGQGFGAAALGGKGMGGGTLANAAEIAYMSALQRHVKSGWRWAGVAQNLRAGVLVQIEPDGKITDVRIAQSSGNSSFDDSVIRAIYKASPVPPAPAEYYYKFKEVRFWFDPNQS